MAYNHTGTHGTDLLHRAQEVAQRVLGFFTETMGVVATANCRMGEVARLSDKSDAQLAAMGLRREDIVRHVFNEIRDV